ncbi:hypothetical protein [Methylomonas albis]|uniref:SlyX protein n=1 Tax=Methylomonas albis TaxID=1854563 RepID=A0ABR9CU89_9GAMM|nr:hypothetical protein [Methylomonas albis]MBD9354297.1 hypothetical protein [Methylomonas albis]
MKTRRSRSKLDKMSPEALDASFPSARYFQVHFEYLHETINDLKQQISHANQQIAGLQQQLQAHSLEEMPKVNYASETKPAGNLRQS